MLKRKFELISSVCCDKGDLRSSNQDRILALSGELSGHNVGLYVVADGCGGLAYGEEISRLLVESFEVIWQGALPQLLAIKGFGEKKLAAAFVAWLQQINSVAYAFGLKAQVKVGSTLTLLLLIDNAYYLMNVGDSRAYIYRNEELRQLSEDQSLVADMLRNREISPEDAEQYERRNVLTMCVGYFEQVQSFCQSGRIKRGDIFLLCSDGLHSLVNERLLAHSLPARIDEMSAKQLRELIPSGKAHDNVSVLLVQVL